MDTSQRASSGLQYGDMADIDFRLLFESAPGLFLVLLPDFRIVAVSDAYVAATMTRREEIVGRGIFEVFPDNPDDPDATGVRNLSASLNRVLQEKRADVMAVQKYDVERPESEGGGFEERYWSPANSPVFGPDGGVIYIIHRVEDVTEFVKLRQRQVEQERSFAESLHTQNDRIEAEIFQRAQEIQEVNSKLREAKVELESRVQERTVQLVEANEALRNEIRQSRKLEEQFRQAQKMEAIGTLAGGLAHDFNNLLTVIVGYADILLSDPATPGSERGLIEQIKKAGERAASLTGQLLAFSRQQVIEPRVLDLNAIVTDMNRMLRRVIGEDVALRSTLARELGRVRADPGQLEQIIMNLAVNARDAMPNGGELTIETANVDLDEPYAQSHLEVQPGRYVMLAISDSGLGMSEEVQRRIFEPFFTTKEKGKGTGLGLATVFGIVKQNGGHIWVYSEVGQGTTFKIYLPLIEDEAAAGRPVVRTARAVGNETILVVEDDDAVRSITVLALRTFGYNVLEASSGAEAIGICKAHEGTIHLMVSDVVMPQMGGRATSEAVVDLREGIRVLFLSGYTDDTVVRHGVLHEQVAFLQKPFTPGALARKVREVLEQAE